MSSSSENISLRGLFSRALDSACKASKLATLDDETQDLVVSSLKDLKALSYGIDVSDMFSPNETLEDLATQHLPYLLVEYVIAEMEGRMRTLDRDERMKGIINSQLVHSEQQHLQVFFRWLAQYNIIPEENQKLYSKRASDTGEPVKRRELKIKQYKAEKELRGSLETIRKRRGQTISSQSSSDDLELIASMLPPPNASEESKEDDSDDESLREIYLIIIQLTWVQAQAQFENMERELELLRAAPPLEPERPKAASYDDPMWRLDPTIPRGGPDGKGPLMDSSGRPLRPFTILPGSSSSERSRMQAEVFRPDHRLPTMTMDEYLEEEKRRGNIITGGGPQSQNALTRSEQLQLDSEMDGVNEAELKAEEKRQEDERWAQYTDLHPKGEGNTMNRG